MSTSFTRRGFLSCLAATGPALAWPDSLGALVPDSRSDERQDYWATVGDAFLIPEDRIYLNVGTLGAQPRVVVEAVAEHTRRVAETYPPHVDWDLLKANVGRVLGGDPAGFVFPRNTTEAMSFVANGLDWSAGDEILTTHHEHIGGRSCWELVAARYGLVLQKLPLPPLAEGPAAVVEVFRAAMTARTRVVSISHVTFTNGRILPVREIATLCRERGIICVVDGAHPPGLMPVDLEGLGVDFYASSPHKWLLAPQGTGLLWMAERWRTRLWPTLASGGWDDLDLGAHRFNHLGSLDESRLAGLVAAFAFFDEIGHERVHERIRVLRRKLIDGLGGIDGVELTSPTDDVQGAGMVSFTVAGVAGLDLQSQLARSDRIRTRVISEFDLGWMRLSPHVYTRESDIETLLGRVAEAGGATRL